MQAVILFSVEARGERRVGDFDGEVIGVELFAEPLDLFGAVGMGGIGESGKEMLIPPDAAAIFRWTAALPGDAGRTGGCLSWRRAFFDDDGVLQLSPKS